MKYTAKTTARLAKKFSTLRNTKEMSLTELERRSGVSRRTIRRIETANVTGHVAGEQNLNKVARALRTTVAALSTATIASLK